MTELVRPTELLDSLAANDIAQIPAAQIRQDTMYDDTDYLTHAPEGFATAELLPKLAWANRK